eukprot:689262-Pleurochrysis_carterae.AAC.2
MQVLRGATLERGCFGEAVLRGRRSATKASNLRGCLRRDSTPAAAPRLDLLEAERAVATFVPAVATFVRTRLAAGPRAAAAVGVGVVRTRCRWRQTCP